MSMTVTDFIRYRIATYYDTSLPADITNPEPPEPPVLDAIAPTSIVGDSTPYPITVTGSSFTSGSKVWADEEAQATTFVDETTLTYNAQADQAGTQTITVRTGSEVSNSVELTVDPAAEVLAAKAPEPDPEPEPEPTPKPKRKNGNGD
jgi:hypothetical protein